jgi:hypothetical protein
MLYREIMAVCSEIHTKHINTRCGQNVEFVNVKPGGTYSNHARRWSMCQFGGGGGEQKGIQRSGSETRRRKHLKVLGVYEGMALK